MTGRGRIWRAVAVLFALVNAAGAVWAFAGREWIHGGIHVALFALTAYLLVRMRADTTEIPFAEEAPARELGADRLEQLQQSVDAIAVEVERIGEAQRFSTKLAAERKEPPR